MASRRCFSSNTISRPVLFCYERSSCSLRVQLSLRLKGIDFVRHRVYAVDDKSKEFLRVNPQGRVPCLLIDGVALSQSSAILEYLEESRPHLRPLLPRDAVQRAKVRAFASVIGCDIQPLQNLGVVKDSVPRGKRGEFAQKWIRKGFDALELHLQTQQRPFCFGSNVSLADVYLSPQVRGAELYNMDISKEYPAISEVHRNLLKLPEFRDVFDENPSLDPVEMKSQPIPSELLDGINLKDKY